MNLGADLEKCLHAPEIDIEKLPDGLSTWLLARDESGNFERSFSNLQVSLGAKPDSYWAKDGNSFIWKGIPDKLGQKLSTLQRHGGGWIMTPALVTLGMGEDFVLVSTSDESTEIIWNLDNYPNLEEIIKVILANGVLGGLRVSSSSRNEPDITGIV